MPTLDVELNGDGVHSIEAPDRFRSPGPFPVALENRGRSTHVHLRFDDDLDRVTAVDEVNHFVEDGATRHVHVSTADVDDPVRGKLALVTGYGSNTRYVDVRIDPGSDAADDRVQVDEAFSEPPDRPPEVPPGQRVTDAVGRLIRRGGVTGAVLGFVAVAAGVALAVAVDSLVVSIAAAVALLVAFGAAVAVAA